MKLGLQAPSWRMLLAAALTLSIAAVAGAKTIETVRGPFAPAWIEAVARPTSNLVATQFDLDMALNQRKTLPTSPCWRCRVGDALSRDPMSAPALRVMAMYAELDGRTDEADKLVNLASRLSRREPLVQYWMIERANRNGNVKDAVQHYDQAIAVRPRLGEVMYPQIIARLDEPAFRSAFADTMRDGRHWIDDFLLAAMGYGDNLPALAATLAEASPSGPINETTAPYERGLIALLASKHDYVTAHNLARRLLGSEAVLRDSSFNERTLNKDYSPLLWSFSEDSEFASGLSDDDTLRVEALSGASGLAVYRVFLLDPGNYRFEADVTPIEGASLPASEWQAHCLAGAEGLLGRASANAEGATRIDLDFTVPRECRAVRLSFSVANGVGQDRAALDLSAASLHKRSN